MTTAPPKVTEQMLALSEMLRTQKDIAETTANQYIRSLVALNEKKPFKTLTFLKRTDEIVARIEKYADSTRKTLYTVITSVLSLMKEKPAYKKAYQFYHDKMMGKIAEAKENHTDTKNEKQAENWIPWSDVVAKKEELGKKVMKDATQFLPYLVMSLYTDIPPRRNKDYLDMVVVKKWDDKMDATKNYLSVADKTFVFNVYKTSKKYGVQKMEIPKPLMDVITSYLKQFHGLHSRSKGYSVPFLIDADKKPLTSVNAITRILNKIFGRKIGSSALRHIYLSDKYGDTLQEQKADSAAMGHSLSQQRDYIKNDGEPEVIRVELPTV